MIWKLSLTGIKSRLKDYIVLFSGLVVASMIFYMFMTLATNSSFMKDDVMGKMTYLTFIFGMGIVLLAIITLVYLIYANTFLLSMRKHDYGMFMMLGAKSSRIGLLIFLETLVTGVLAAVMGIILGFGLTAIVSRLLINQLGLKITQFQVVYPPAILWTLVFFVAIFLFAALRNARKLTHAKVVDLLHEDQTPVNLKKRPVLTGIEAILGLVLLAAGYYVMKAMNASMLLMTIPIALVTIVFGSYLTFNAFCTMLVNWLLKKKSFSYHGLRTFTLGQLKFRLKDYTKILTITSLLFALALGAITVGLNFNTLKNQAEESTYYDATITSTAPAVQKYVDKLSIKSKQTYNYKETEAKLYFNKDEFVNNPVHTVNFKSVNNAAVYTKATLKTAELAKENSNANLEFSSLIPNGEKKIKLVSAAKFAHLAGEKKFVSFILVNNFEKDYPNLLKIERAQTHTTPGFSNVSTFTKPVNYELMVGLLSGFEFMGFFLGLAFLTMLASTLMFKVLSGAASDKIRYKMLDKIGARKKTLKKSMAQEIGTLFILPGILGVIDVLFGLQLFKSLLPHPYAGLWLPFTIFIALYFFYYVLTVKLYEKIALA